MTQPPRERGPLGQLIDDAKTRSGKEWRTIEYDSRIPLSSIQSWISGRTPEPPLRGLLHLARYLNIPLDELADAALDGYVPPLARSDGPLESVVGLLPGPAGPRGGPRRRP